VKLADWRGDRSSQGVGRLMVLTMRPTGLGHGVYKDNIDYNIFSGEWEVGRIYETRGGRYFLPNSCLSPSFD
jgi:hypothetical protein